MPGGNPPRIGVPRTWVRASSLLALALWATVALAACRGPAGSVTIVATTVQIAALAREVVRGTAVQVTSIVPEGVDPHEYGPSPDAVKRLGGARVVLRHGLGLDAFLDQVIANSGQRQVVIVTAGAKVREVAGENGKREADPHVWHDPANVTVMVEGIVTALGAAYPDRADTFRASGAAYQAKLDRVDAEIRQIVQGIPEANRKVVTDHDALGYFFDRYGITSVGAVIPAVSAQGDTSARAIARLRDTIQREGVRAILASQSVDPKVARELAKDTGVKIVTGLYGDSLGKPGSGQETVDGMLLFNARKIAGALK